MDITQLLITVGAVLGVLLIGVLAIVPSLLDRPDGADQAEPDEVEDPADHPEQNGLDLAA